jgi:hypothetical protein
LPQSLSEARALVAAMQTQARARRCDIPEPPEEPLPESCCGRGCEPCVFTSYYQALDAWRSDIEADWRGE